MMNISLDTIKWPRQIEPAVYNEVRDEYVEKLIHTPGVHAVLQYGSVGMPGLSDLDLIVVVDKDSPPPRESLQNLSCHPEASYVFCHNVAIVPEDIMDKLGYLAFCDNLNLIAGKGELPSAVDPADAECIVFALTTDALLDRLCALAKDELVGMHDPRSLLLHLHSLRHTVRLCRDLGMCVSPHVDDFSNRVGHFRQHWFANPNVRQLQDLAKEGIRLFLTIANSLGMHGSSKGWWDHEDTQRYRSIICFANKYAVLFDTSQESLERHPYASCIHSLRLLGRELRGQKFVLRVSHALWGHFAAYSAADRHLNELGWDIWKDSRGTTPARRYADILYKRLQLIRHHVTFLERHSLPCGSTIHAGRMFKPMAGKHRLASLRGIAHAYLDRQLTKKTKRVLDR